MSTVKTSIQKVKQQTSISLKMAKSRSKEIHMKHDLIASWKTTSKLDIAT
jgi:hypothetical protein